MIGGIYQIRNLKNGKKYVPKVYSMHKLAEEYAVSIGTVFSIINNKTWKGVKKCH